MAEPSGPLTGVRVLSLAEQLPGPICGLLLADLGAEVTLLERPDGGDPQRRVGKHNFRFAARAKRSVALDLKHPPSLVAAKQLVRQSDVVVEGFRPGVLARLGLGYDDARSLNPAIVYCSISGYGQTGPLKRASGHNLNYEAISGLLAPFVSGQAGEYFTEAPPWGDIVSGITAALGIVAAIRQAERTGDGTWLDLSITDSLVFALGPALTRHCDETEGFPRHEAAYGIFRCTDGHIALGINHEDHLWQGLCHALSLTEYAELDHQQRRRCREEIRDRIQQIIERQPVEHWVQALAEVAACSPVNTLDAALADSQLMSRQLFVRALDEHGAAFTTVRSPLGPERTTMPRVPALGEQTADVLTEAGLSEAELEAIVAHSREGES